MLLDLVFIRHGMTAGNQERRYIGQNDDQPLSEHGRRMLIARQADGLYPRVQAVCLTGDQHAPPMLGKRLIVVLADIAAFLVAGSHTVPNKYKIQKHRYSPYFTNSEQTASVISRIPCDSST